MKRKLILLVMLLLTAMIISGCDVTGIIPPISENPELTPEEIELIRKWGYGGDYVVRWPDGYVDVYDATGYSQMQEVLNQWNTVIGGPVVFRLSSNPNSPVRIIFNPDMSYCGLEDVQWGDDYVFSEVIIEISPDEYTCETYNPNTKYCSYLVMFNAVVGFNYWTEIDPSPFEDWSNFNTIPDTIKTMVHALYKVPPGYCLLNANPEPKIEKVEGVKWNPNYQDTKYPYFLVDYYGKSLVPPPSGDNDYEYPDSIEKGSRFYLIITGKNFGNKKGNISLEGKGQINKKTQNFTIDIIEWSDNKIKVCPRFENEDLAFEPVKDAVLTVYRPDGKKAEKPVDIIPSIGRQPFGQCTWWTYRRRMEEGKSIPYYYGGAYLNKVNLNQNYVPEKYDILIWFDYPHQAFVEEVINKEKGTVRISEYNVNYLEELYNGEEGYVTGENKIYNFSPKSFPADYYYR